MGKQRQFGVTASDGLGKIVRVRFSERELRQTIGEAVIEGVRATQLIEEQEPPELTDEDREKVFASVLEAMLHGQ